MSSRENQLISRIIRGGPPAMAQVLRWGIDAEDFRTGVANSMFTYMINYYRCQETRGSVPGEYASQQVFPNFVLCDDGGMSVDALCLEVRKNAIALEMNEKLYKSSEELQYDPEAALEKVYELVSWGRKRMTSIHKTDTAIGTAADETLLEYHKRKTGEGLPRLQWPWPVLQEATGGIWDDDYVILYGRHGQMKTWIMLYVAAHQIRSGARVIIYTKEMSKRHVMDRLLCILAGIPHHDLRMGQLTPEREALITQWRDYLCQPEVNERVTILSAQGIDDADTVAWLDNKCDIYKPDVVFVDGIYLMSARTGKNDANHDKVRKISQQLRQMVLSRGIPVVGTIQANRDASKNKKGATSEIAFSDAVGADATVVFRTLADPAQGKLKMVTTKMREGKLPGSGIGFRIKAIPAVDFTQDGEGLDCCLTEEDMADKKEKEDPSRSPGMMSESDAMKALMSRINQEVPSHKPGGLQVPSGFGPLPHNYDPSNRAIK